MPPYDVRPRPRNAEAQAAAGIKQAEDLGLIPVAGDSAPFLDVSLGETTRERDYRVKPPAPKDGTLPFRVK